MRFRAQKVLMAAAFLCYAEALAAFALHAAEIAGGAPAFFNAFYGSPSVMTPYAMAGYAGQCLAVFALMLIAQWWDTSATSRRLRLRSPLKQKKRRRPQRIRALGKNNPQ